MNKLRRVRDRGRALHPSGSNTYASVDLVDIE
jgi:hypothetical protein